MLRHLLLRESEKRLGLGMNRHNLQVSTYRYTRRYYKSNAYNYISPDRRYHYLMKCLVYLHENKKIKNNYNLHNPNLIVNNNELAKQDNTGCMNSGWFIAA